MYEVMAQVDMSNIIDQAQKIIEANGFKDSESLPDADFVPALTRYE